ncbi:dethiobiotin synthase [Thiohalocapsa sp. ML1]|uniref:dethiobiotin synthase n=1 Tax=Thiohalocapsa sp. ML1 TaxID=1431688 RepID=UPI00073202FB|nr:dethiobiotin synthase [Thiohalocapsa sp. ML1]
MNGLIVIGTDTGVGKTEIAAGLIAAFRTRGVSAIGMKPIAAGCVPGDDGLQSNDAIKLIAAGGIDVPYREVNPYALAEPIAPHVAAGLAGVDIKLGRIRDAYQALSQRAERVIVEGVGGWRVPLGPALSLSDLPSALGLPVVMVVGLRLGCLNHSLLTAESVRARGVRLVGWIANEIDPDMLARDENIATLAALIDAPTLGVVPRLLPPTPEVIAEYLNLEPLLR